MARKEIVINTGGGGGIAIGDAISGGTAPAVLFVGAGDVLAQDPTNFFYDPVNFNALFRSTDGTGNARLELTSAFTSYGFNLATFDGANNYIALNGSAGTPQLSTTAGDASNTFSTVISPTQAYSSSSQILDVIGLWDSHPLTSRPFAGAYKDDTGVSYASVGISNGTPSMNYQDVATGASSDISTNNSGVFANWNNSSTGTANLSLTDNSGNPSVDLSTSGLSGEFAGLQVDGSIGAGVVATDGSNSTSILLNLSGETTINSTSSSNTVSTEWSAGAGTITHIVNDGVDTSILSQSSQLFNFNKPVEVPADAYGSGWDGNPEVPQKNAIYDIFGTATPSGTYSPTASATSNLDSTPTVTGRYIRIGNTVMVSGTFFANPTATGTASFEVTLPFASNFSSSDQATGSFTINGAITPSEGGSILAQTTTDRFRFEWQATNIVSQTYTWQAMYQII